MTRGILKNSNPGEGIKRLKWDEKNLQEAEAGKNSTMIIDEPKTPWVKPREHHSHSDGEIEDLVPMLSLRRASSGSESRTTTSTASDGDQSSVHWALSDEEMELHDVEHKHEQPQEQQQHEHFMHLRRTHYQNEAKRKLPE